MIIAHLQFNINDTTRKTNATKYILNQIYTNNLKRNVIKLYKILFLIILILSIDNINNLIEALI